MVKTEIGLTDLARETRQRIYDFVSNDAGDQTIKVTLDQHDKLRFENGNTIFDLVLTAKIFAKEVLSYLFQYITFTLTDSLQECHTIRGLLDLAHFTHPFVLESDQRHHGGTIPSAESNSYVLSKLGSDFGNDLAQTTWVLLRDLEYAIQLLNQMSGLKSVKLGVDVIEFIACSIRRDPRERSSNLAGLLEQVSQGTSGVDPASHHLLRALLIFNGVGKLRKVQLELHWNNFVLERYREAGVVFGPPWTNAVRQEMEECFEDMVFAWNTGLIE
ncbi:hypothetical protein BKA58DRAFT_444183 [Alternaria rosae]|uniref:uncharacterized protein n=1 Tax=Alternaria rosae TaxID=1187941 RepID=UPI001E8D70CB|nr:uncharacterized protein BKA58DRAFT_444183 [Alternaria rosae]KAH6859004.1 hypothetical protein BKA58DRAFT_444183 [Alternaria rosae]